MSDFPTDHRSCGERIERHHSTHSLTLDLLLSTREKVRALVAECVHLAPMPADDKYLQKIVRLVQLERQLTVGQVEDAGFRLFELREGLPSQRAGELADDLEVDVCRVVGAMPGDFNWEPDHVVVGVARLDPALRDRALRALRERADDLFLRGEYAGAIYRWRDLQELGEPIEDAALLEAASCAATCGDDAAVRRAYASLQTAPPRELLLRCADALTRGYRERPEQNQHLERAFEIYLELADKDRLYSLGRQVLDVLVRTIAPTLEAFMLAKRTSVDSRDPTSGLVVAVKTMIAAFDASERPIPEFQLVMLLDECVRHSSASDEEVREWYEDTISLLATYIASAKLRQPPA